MPLINVDVVRGRTQQQLERLLDAVHEAMVEAFGVHHADRYQLLTQHDPHEVAILDTGLGISRSRDVVIIRMVSRRRSDEAKTSLYRLLTEKLESDCGIAPDDVVVSIVENGAADWSFGQGSAQFITGELPD